MFEHFHANICATTHVSFPLQLSAHLSECVNAPSTCSFKRYGCVFQVSIRHLSFPVADILPWETVDYSHILMCKFWTFSLCQGAESPRCMGDRSHVGAPFSFRWCFETSGRHLCWEGSQYVPGGRLHLKPAHESSRQIELFIPWILGASAVTLIEAHTNRTRPRQCVCVSPQL